MIATHPDRKDSQFNDASGEHSDAEIARAT
jgi:hypothetical protein